MLTPQARETTARRFGILDIERSHITLVRFRILDLQPEQQQRDNAEVTVTCECDEDDPTMLNINFVLTLVFAV